MPETLADHAAAVREIAHREVLRVVAEQQDELTAMRRRLEVQATAQRERQRELSVIASELEGARETLERQTRRLHALAGTPPAMERVATTSGLDDLPGETPGSSPSNASSSGAASSLDPSAAAPASPAAAATTADEVRSPAAAAPVAAPRVGAFSSAGSPSSAALVLARSSEPSAARSDDPSADPAPPRSAVARILAVDPTGPIRVLRGRDAGLVTGTGGRLPMPTTHVVEAEPTPPVPAVLLADLPREAPKASRRRRRWLRRLA